MKLMTKEIERKFKKIGRQENVKDPIVVAKFFNPAGAGTWWAIEAWYVLQNGAGVREVNFADYDPKKYEGYVVVDTNFFGYVSIHGDHCDEWGSFSLSGLQEFKGSFGLGIERDGYFDQKPMSKACPKAIGAIGG
jgi:hypothetical protein